MTRKEFSLQQIDSDHFKNLPKELLSLWRIPFNSDTEPSKLIIALRERIKELNCLYGIGQIAERHSDSIEDLLQEIVNFLPFSWQYPEITAPGLHLKKKHINARGSILQNGGNHQGSSCTMNRWEKIPSCILKNDHRQMKGRF